MSTLQASKDQQEDVLPGLHQSRLLISLTECGTSWCAQQNSNMIAGLNQV